MALEQVINQSNIAKEVRRLGQEIDQIVEAGGEARVITTKKSNGTIPLLKLWRMWMKDIASYLASQGRKMPLGMDKDGNWYGSRPYEPNDAHEAYSYLCLGCDEFGVRYSWVVNSDEFEGRTAAPLGVRLRAMDKLYKHAMEEGIKLRIPKNTEYEELTKKTEQ